MVDRIGDHGRPVFPSLQSIALRQPFCGGTGLLSLGWHDPQRRRSRAGDGAARRHFASVAALGGGPRNVGAAVVTCGQPQPIAAGGGRGLSGRVRGNASARTGHRVAPLAPRAVRPNSRRAGASRALFSDPSASPSGARILIRIPPRGYRVRGLHLCAEPDFATASRLASTAHLRTVAGKNPEDTGGFAVRANAGDGGSAGAVEKTDSVARAISGVKPDGTRNSQGPFMNQKFSETR